MAEGATSSLFQSRFWGEFKSHFGWSTQRLALAEDDVLVLSRRVAPGIDMAYVPHPSPRVDLAALHQSLSTATGTEGGERAPTFLRVDPLPNTVASVESAGNRAAPAQASVPAPFRKAPIDVQSPATTVLDLRPSEEELLAGMKSKTRYNVRLAAKRGVRVREAEAASGEVDRWYELYRETAQRDRIAIHSQAYYRRLLETARSFSDVHLSLYLAEHEGDLLGGIIAGRYGSAAVYLYGASSSSKRNLMAPYLLQWEAIRQAKAAGAQSYDFFGIPPAEDPQHPMHGLYRFKVGFGGAILVGPGSHDAPFRPLRYLLFRGAERARYFYFKVLKKRIGGGS
ncbi:MAG: peptidoglycan bridge formation glycyltransferase FemA/FemB family protein [Spirochaetes bacterium]|jgi:lipid II:glycine glycyltransferase (peptidoglycan interpeptide bridge formation enzyme)|nr:peptidoglycan bridge formation glycyltransferase FemA/FemB family protein [Spirochaetota bacterium]